MKESKFNIYIPNDGDDQIVLFNAFTGSISLVDRELRDAVRNGNISLIDERILQSMKALGFVLDEDVAEVSIYEYEVKSKIFNPLEYEFCIFTNSDCNLACNYCDCKDRVPTVMDGQALERSTEFIKKQSLESNRKYVNLRLFGGEPMLHPEVVFGLLEEISSWSSSYNIKFNSALITNGTLLSAHMVERLSPLLSVAQLTLEGSKEHHNTIRRYKNGRGTYEEVVKSALLLQEKEIPICLRLHVTPKNAEDIESLFIDLSSRGLNCESVGILICPVVPRSHICSFYPLSCNPCEENLALLPDVWKRAIDYGFNVLSKPVGNHIILSCPLASNFSFIIGPTGDLYKCLKMVSIEKGGVAHIGERGDIMGIEHQMIDLISHDASRFHLCSDCPYLPLGNGKCAYESIISEEIYQIPYCDSCKRLINEKINVYLRQKVR